MKAGRVSYDVITPSAARSIFEAILWKPAIQWQIKRIEVLNPIRWTNIRRNEVSSVASPRSQGILIEDSRTQRAATLLTNVKYRLYAEFTFIPPDKRAPSLNPAPEWLADDEENQLYTQAETTPMPDEKEAKYAAMFDRRASKGQCFTQPFSVAGSFPLPPQKDPYSIPLTPGESRSGLYVYDLNYLIPKHHAAVFP